MRKLYKNYSLRKHNTFKLDVNADLFFSFTDIIELKAFLKDSMYQHLPRLVLGGGSNVLFTDDYQGVVIHPKSKKIQIKKETDKSVLLKVNAGVKWDTFVEFCVKNGFGGVENLSWIPGNVGAAPIQNIGAYGVEVKEVITKVEAVHLSTHQIYQFSPTECQFGYRESIFKKDYAGQFIITDVFFKLCKNPALNTNYELLEEKLKEIGRRDIKAVREAVIGIRQNKLPDPEELPNAGSFFKNPVLSDAAFSKLHKHFPKIPHYEADEGRQKIPAGWLIEQTGWKGKRQNGAGVYEKQALILVNYDCNDGEKLEDLAKSVQTDVLNKFGILLEREVNVV